MLRVISVLTWMLEHKRATVELLMAFALFVGGWRYNRQQAAAEATKAEQEGLAAGLRGQLKLVNGQLEILRRDSNGKVIYKKVYVPPEGSVVVTQKEEAAMRGQLKDLAEKLAAAMASGNKKAADDIQKQIDHVGGEVDIKVVDHGFTFKPGYGADWANHGLALRLDFKAYYWHRYSLIGGGGLNGVGIGVSRHIDDLVWGHPQNVEIFAGYNFFRLHGTDAPYVIGIRSNF